MKVISEESERLSNMVEELLDFSRIQGGRFNLNKANMDVFAELTDAVIIYSEKARQENKTLLYDEPQEIVTIFGDRNRIRQVFINIIDNAIKYSAAYGHIIVATAVTDKAVIITVEDDGCGIASSDLTKVKAKFYKANSTVRGSGIGLAVADEIVAAHDGTLNIESELGRYTRVVITLPVAKRTNNKKGLRLNMSEQKKEVIKTKVGGQALIEGVMMLGPKKAVWLYVSPTGRYTRRCGTGKLPSGITKRRLSEAV